MVARFYERFGDHAVNLARRLASLVTGSPEPCLSRSRLSNAARTSPASLFATPLPKADRAVPPDSERRPDFEQPDHDRPDRAACPGAEERRSSSSG